MEKSQESRVAPELESDCFEVRLWNLAKARKPFEIPIPISARQIFFAALCEEHRMRMEVREANVVFTPLD